MNSRIFSVNWRELGTSAILAALSAALLAVFQFLQNCTMISCLVGLDWVGILDKSGYVFVFFIISHFMTTEDGKLLGAVKWK